MGIRGQPGFQQMEMTDMDGTRSGYKVRRQTGAFYPQPKVRLTQAPLSSLELLEDRTPEQQQALAGSPLSQHSAGLVSAQLKLALRDFVPSHTFWSFLFLKDMRQFTSIPLPSASRPCWEPAFHPSTSQLALLLQESQANMMRPKLLLPVLPHPPSDILLGCFITSYPCRYPWCEHRFSSQLNQNNNIKYYYYYYYY